MALDNVRLHIIARAGLAFISAWFSPHLERYGQHAGPGGGQAGDHEESGRRHQQSLGLQKHPGHIRLPLGG